MICKGAFQHERYDGPSISKPWILTNLSSLKHKNYLSSEKFTRENTLPFPFSLACSTLACDNLSVESIQGMRRMHIHRFLNVFCYEKVLRIVLELPVYTLTFISPLVNGMENGFIFSPGFKSSLMKAN